MNCAHQRKYLRIVDGKRIDINWTELEWIERERERDKDYMRDKFGRMFKWYDQNCVICCNEKPTRCTSIINIDCELPYGHDGECYTKHVCQCWCKENE